MEKQEGVSLNGYVVNINALLEKARNHIMAIKKELEELLHSVESVSEITEEYQ